MLPATLCPMLPTGSAHDPEVRSIIAAGPLTHQPDSVPYRIVLVGYTTGKYSVHSETFDNFPTIDTEFHKSSLANGSYFPAGKEGFVEAMNKFTERLNKSVENMTSIFRE